MAVARCLLAAFVGGLFWVVQAGAQGSTGTITGRVVDAASQQPLSNATVRLSGTQRGALTRDDGSFTLSAVPAGAQRVRVSRIGYAAFEQDVTIDAGRSVTVQFALQPVATVLGEQVTIGYGTQRREAITGSVATVDVDDANVGVIPNVNGMIQGRVAGVNVTVNNGEPGAGAQIRIRGGTSISASNEPLYVIDGVPIQNSAAEPSGIGIGGAPSLPRSALNLLNPSDIESIAILKDASATAIYGSRGANGVVLIETKKGISNRTGMEYDGYTATSRPSRYLDVLNGDEYRKFIQAEITAGRLPADRMATLGTANTDWERAVTAPAKTQNHNISFFGGTQDLRYRASLNYMKQEGVVLDNGFERYQARLNSSQTAFGGRLRVGLNLTSTFSKNDFLTYETTGGFEGGVLVNMVNFNPTHPIRVVDPGTGKRVYFETGGGRQSVRNPVALARQVDDVASTIRTLGNISADLSLLSNLSATVNVGIDRSEGTRQTYFPAGSPVGAEWNGRARQANRNLTSVTFQSVLKYDHKVGDGHDIGVIGGYEHTQNQQGGFGAEAQSFSTDALGFWGLPTGNVRVAPSIDTVANKTLVSVFSRASYSFSDRYFLTGSIRYDGASNFGSGNKWAVFPGISGSWRISEESFMPDGPLSELRLRVGWGIQGNPGVPAYSSLMLLQASSGNQYVFGEQAVVGYTPSQSPNENLKWEETEQYNLAVDYGLYDSRFSGSIEYYVKNTRDLLLTVPVPAPAPSSTRLENIGRLRNHGLEMTLDAKLFERPEMSWTAGLVFAAERGEVVDLGGRSFIPTGIVSGQGLTGTMAQRIIPGYALGTFYGPQYAGVDNQGRQQFNDYTVVTDAEGRVVSRTLVGKTTSPGADDFVVIGDANPDFTLSLSSNGTWRKFDASFLMRSEMGRDVFNNTALVYATKSNALQNKNFLASALNDGIAITQAPIYSSKWIEDGSFIRLQNVTVGYTFDVPYVGARLQRTRVYLSGDNLLLLTDYSGYDPEVHTDGGLGTRGMDYLNYPRPRTVTAGVSVAF